ncbi:hypothetical protein Pmani_004075 [Petrolisthes manimaculis]|uniref:Alpha/beta hydrolase fold-3 domain-containing protein n=1 Tax=Petrolisthes manimaculis TaxID=1843537 RepID=A0AAE1QFE3_9EUCA|nr:hypothetical protein Pmani_004075 [Petrolisthes manimaculis]
MARVKEGVIEERYGQSEGVIEERNGHGVVEVRRYEDLCCPLLLLLYINQLSTSLDLGNFKPLELAALSVLSLKSVNSELVKRVSQRLSSVCDGSERERVGAMGEQTNPTHKDWRTWTLKELEHEYSPSRWCERYSADEVVKQHIDITTRASLVARQTVHCQLNVRYHQGPRALLDVYGEDLPHESPVFVYVHGGFWQWKEGGKDISNTMVTNLHSQGIVTVVLQYDIAPQVGIGEMVEQVRRGVLWACKLATGRGSVGVVLAGWSAGGQLVTQVVSQFGGKEGTNLDMVRGVVSLSGIFDLRPLVSTYVNEPLHLTESTAWSLSPLSRVDGLKSAWVSKGLAFLPLVGQQESNEFKRQAREYAKAWQEVGLEAEEVKVLEGIDHFSIIEDMAVSESPVIRHIIAFINDCTKRKK